MQLGMIAQTFKVYAVTISRVLGPFYRQYSTLLSSTELFIGDLSYEARLKELKLQSLEKEG